MKKTRLAILVIIALGIAAYMLNRYNPEYGLIGMMGLVYGCALACWLSILQAKDFR